MNLQNEQEEITPSDEYIKGFNEGYIMSKFNPNFSLEDVKQTNPSDRSKGFEKGIMQSEVEKKFDKVLPSLSKQYSTKENERNIGKMDKDSDRD